MKRFIFSYIIIAFVFSYNIFAQVPQKFNYQGVARTTTGIPLANQTIGLKISILQGNPGKLIYSERHTPKTNTFGLYVVSIGDGTIINGEFSSIPWVTGNIFSKVEIDPAGGTAYVELGSTELLSVPYALEASGASKLTLFDNDLTENPDKMVIQHSLNYPTWGLQYHDTTDVFKFLSNGYSVMDIRLGIKDFGVKLNAPLAIVDGSQGANKVLTSDAQGNASWENFATKVSAFQPPGCKKLESVTSTFKKIGDLGTFTKTTLGTFIELNWQSSIFVEQFIDATGVVYELRIDDLPTSIGNATALFRSTQVGSYLPINITGIYSGLTVGEHTVSVWAKGTLGSATNAFYDAGCFNNAGTNIVLVKEFK